MLWSWAKKKTRFRCDHYPTKWWSNEAQDVNYNEHVGVGWSDLLRGNLMASSSAWNQYHNDVVRSYALLIHSLVSLLIFATRCKLQIHHNSTQQYTRKKTTHTHAHLIICRCVRLLGHFEHTCYHTLIPNAYTKPLDNRRRFLFCFFSISIFISCFLAPRLRYVCLLQLFTSRLDFSQFKLW